QATCVVPFNPGDQVFLHAIATPNSYAWTFTSWGGACSTAGTGACTLSMTGDATVTAFIRPRFTLTVSPTPMYGGISGTGLSCGNGGTTCSVNVYGGIGYALAATPQVGMSFWTGDAATPCNNRFTGRGALSCTVTPNASMTISASFLAPANPNPR